MIGLFSYFLRIKYLYLVSSLIIITLITILLYLFLDSNISILFVIIVMNLTILIGFILPLFKLKEFKQNIGKGIRWYFVDTIILIGFIPLSIYISIQGLGYGLYYSDETVFIILNYFIAIVIHFVFLVYFINLEYIISNKQQHQLKDKYSHNLGNIMQAITSSSDLIKISANLNKQDASNLDLISEKCKEASKLIKEIRKL